MRARAPYLSTSCWRSHSLKYGASESTSGFSISDDAGRAWRAASSYSSSESTFCSFIFCSTRLRALASVVGVGAR